MTQAREQGQVQGVHVNPEQCKHVGGILRVLRFCGAVTIAGISTKGHNTSCAMTRPPPAPLLCTQLSAAANEVSSRRRMALLMSCTQPGQVCSAGALRMGLSQMLYRMKLVRNGFILFNIWFKPMHDTPAEQTWQGCCNNLRASSHLPLKPPAKQTWQGCFNKPRASSQQPLPHLS